MSTWSLVFGGFAAFYAVITVFVLTMTVSEQLRMNRLKNPFVVAGSYLACLVWPLVAVVLLLLMWAGLYPRYRPVPD